ncbi:unnamed protein product [Boreogadus saida]
MKHQLFNNLFQGALPNSDHHTFTCGLPNVVLLLPAVLLPVIMMTCLKSFLWERGYCLMSYMYIKDRSKYS